jgi:hypothetical protein
MSEFKFACPVCGQHMMCDVSHGGSVMECPTCFQKITAPHAPAPDSKFILTGTKLTEKKISAPLDRPAAAAPEGKFPAAIVAGVLAAVLAAAVAAILFFAPSKAPLKQGAAGLGTWNTAAEFNHFVITRGNRVLFKGDFSAGTNGWRFGNGAWAVQNGVLRQSAIAENCRALAGESGWGDYTLSVQARKVGGNEGFLILFNTVDGKNWAWWNVGGWNNTKYAIETCVDGNKSTLGDKVAGQIETGKWYDLRVELNGLRVRCYLNNALVHDVTYPAPARQQ